MSLKLEAMAKAVGLFGWAIRFPESTASVRRPVHTGLASRRLPPAVARPPVPPEAPAGVDAGSMAGPPLTGTGEQGPELLGSTSTSPPVVTFAPGHERSTAARAAASCVPLRAAAPSSTHGLAPHSSAHSWPVRTISAPRRGGGGGTAGRAVAPARLPPPCSRGGRAGGCWQEAPHHSLLGKELRPPSVPRVPLPLELCAWIPKDGDPHSTVVNLTFPSWAVGTEQWGVLHRFTEGKRIDTIIYFRNAVYTTFLVLGTRGLSRSLLCWEV
nr:uncharacterized protein LOC110540719 [Meriones unguiculatus]